ncbi:MAG: hypothetical protein HY079_07260 [Elusimicrobia bacterium]|nr:hypothetical protein [Elusimicrobiota bacterium]
MLRALLAVLAAAAAALPAAAALSYTRWAHPKGDYALEYPADWKRSVGLETLILHPAGRSGKLTTLTVEKHPLGKAEAATPAAFVDQLLKDAQGLRRLDSRDTVKVGGKDAERLVLTETTPLKGKLGTMLPGPMTEVVVVVPLAKGFYALRMSAVGGEFASARPEFDRLVAGLKLGPKAR